MRNVVYLVVFIFCIKSVNAQQNDRQAAAYNIVTNTIVGGIGAVINKKPNEKFHKVLLKGMGQGTLGGYVIFESKRLVRNLSRTEDYSYVWPSKLLNAVGNSIVYNAASNRNFWERWHINIGFNHLEYDFKRDKKLRYRILPFALSGTVGGLVKGNLDLKRTLYTGTPIFNLRQQDKDYMGYALANTISYYPAYLENTTEILAHEIIHTYQYSGYFYINTFLDKPIKRLEGKSDFAKNYNKVFLTDFNFLLMQSINTAQDIFGVEYGNQLHEKEAAYYQDEFFRFMN